MDQYSPKSSPRPLPVGARSPSIAGGAGSASVGGQQHHMESAAGQSAAAAGGGGGGLKMTISLKQKMPFYLMRPDPVPSNETTGATNLMAARGLEHSYNKLTSE
jgi:hypothetical protein